jgi:hypothetical protein
MVLSTYAVGSEATGIEILGSDVSIDNGIVYARNLVARSTGSSTASNTGWFNFKAFDSSPVATFYSSTDTLLASVPAAGGVRVSYADPGSGAASTTTLTNATGTPVNAVTPAGYAKVYIGTVASYFPYYQ